MFERRKPVLLSVSWFIRLHIKLLSLLSLALFLALAYFYVSRIFEDRTTAVIKDDKFKC